MEPKKRNSPATTGLRRLVLVLLCVFGLCGMTAGEPDPYEGRMKLETDHFVIIFEPADSAAADHLASIAEDAYRKVTSYYGSYPQKIYCVVDGRSDSYASAYFPLPAHIRLSVYAPTWPLFSPRNSDWLELVLIHELTHNVQLTYDWGFFNALSTVFGSGLNAFPGLFLPTWAIEGPAVLTESLLASGGRGDSEHFEMLSKILAGSAPVYTRAGSSTVYAPQQRPYVAGYLVADYLHRTYGADVLKNIQREFVRFPFFGPGRAVKKATGKKAKEIFLDAIAGFGSRVEAESFQSASERITPDVYGDYYLPQVTERGWIMYRYTHDLPAALVLYDPESGKEEVLQVTGLTDPSCFSADPSGKTVVFTSRVTVETAAGTAVYSDLFLLDTETRETERLTTGRQLWHPAVNPRDGTVIAVSGTGSESALVSVDLNTGELKTLFRREHATIYNPVFSADGGKVYFTMNAGGMQDIWAIPYHLGAAPGGFASNGVQVNPWAAIPVTGPDPSGEFFPRWSDGSLLFASDRSGDLALYALPPGGGTAVPVARDPVGAYAGFIEGNTVIYATYTQEGYALKRTSLSDFTATSPAPIDTAGNQPFPPEEDARTGAPAAGRTVAAANDLPPPAGKRYYDLPRLLYWAPFPFSVEPGGNLNIGSAAGIFAATGSILGDNNLSAAFTFDWDEMAPATYITGNSRAGKTVLGYDFYYAGTDSRTLDLGLEAAYPLLFERRFPHSRSLQLYGGVGLYSEKQTENPAYTEARAYTGILHTVARSGARKDFFDPGRLSAWASVSTAIPFGMPENSLISIGAGSYAQIPSLIDHHVIGIGLDTRYNPLLNTDASAVATAGELLSDQVRIFQARASLEYRFHIALLDAPLPYGYSLNHLAGGLFLESRAFASYKDIGIDPYLYPGFELFTNIGTVNHLPVGMGVRFRVAPASLSEFSILKDMSIYLTTGTGGFVNRGAVTAAFLDAPPGGGYAGSRW